MTEPKHRPVILLAFANDRDDTIGYLRNLPDEARRLREVLEPAEEAGLCELVVRSNCTAGDLFKVFQDPKYRNRVAILHYGGHANGYQLLLESASGESAAADAGGLAAFLAQQQGLQLVVLNGCSTQPQTRALLDAQVPAVISTSRAIEDEVALDFAVHFHRGLASGASIRTAYGEAEATVKTARGGETRGLYVAGADGSASPEADRWPWQLELRPGSESSDQWNLPEAAGDPLFGLPPLPEQDLPESPYRHLKWFTRKDAEVFFGRGHQIRELYDRITAPRTPPILLFYGQSGVGKSSLLDAGLMLRLEQDHEVRYVRRGSSGLLESLRSALDADESTSVEQAWRACEERVDRPLIVFLDQVEELYTRPLAGSPDELEKFLDVVKSLFADTSERPRGKLVLSFRKEWLAELEARLVAAELPRAKVFLEPLDRRGIVEAVCGPTRSERLQERYGLIVEDELDVIIADDLLADRESAIAPTLQILLTKLWTRATEENYEQPTFSKDLYQTLHREGTLLRDFLDQQLAAFRARYPEAVDSGLLLDIIALHTTPLGTADHCSVEMLQEQYAHLGASLPDLLQHCQDLHLLTVAANARKDAARTTRLAHDTLAPLVRKRFEESDKPGQRARRILDNRSIDWEGEQTGTPLDEADLAIVERGAVGTRALTATEARLLAASRELQERLQRNRRMVRAAAAVTTALIAVLALFGWWKSKQAEEQKQDARHQEGLAKAETARALEELSRAQRMESLFLAAKALEQIEIGDAGTAVALALEALPRDMSDPKRPWVAEAEEALYRAVASRCARNVLSHEREVLQVKWNPSGTRLATTSSDGTARIWDPFSERETGELAGHEGAVRHVAWSPDGTRLATASSDGTARIWDAASAQETCRLVGHEGAVVRVAWNPDGTRLATASWDGTARIWDPDLGQETGKLARHEGAVHYVAWNPDGTRLATALFGGRTLRIWDPENAQEVRNLAEGLVFGEEIYDVAWHPDGMMLAAGLTDGKAMIWDTGGRRPVELRASKDGFAVNCVAWSPDGRLVTASSFEMQLWTDERATRNDDVGNLEDVAWNPDGTRLATASTDGIVRIWDADSVQENGIGGTKKETGSLSTLATLEGHKGRVVDVAWNPDGTRLATASLDGTARIWALEDGDVLRHEQEVHVVTWSPDGTRLATASFDGTARIWDATSAREIGKLVELEQGLVDVMWSPDGTRLATSVDGTARIWDATSAREIGKLVEHDGYVHVMWSPDGTRLATSGDGTARIWDATSAREIGELVENEQYVNVMWSPDGTRLATTSFDGIRTAARIWDATSAREIGELVEQEHGLVYVTWSPDGTRLATSGDGTARIWDATSAREIGELVGHEGAFVTWSPDGTRLATPSRIWDAASAREIGELVGHEQGLGDVTWSPDGTRLATSGDGTARIWDATSAREIGELVGHERASVTWSPDGTRLATKSPDGTARIWDATSATEIGKLGGGHNDWRRIDVLAWSPDGTRLATASSDGTARIWDAASAQETRRLAHEGAVVRVAWNPDGTRLATASRDGTARIWRVFSSQQLVDHARRVAPRTLTDQQRKQLKLSK